MPLQPLYLESDSLRVGANQFLTQANAVFVGNNLHVGNTLIFSAVGGGANSQWIVPAYSNNKIIIAANNHTPAWGSGAIDLRVGTVGGRAGITFSSNVNAFSDFGYIYFYDTVGGYAVAGGESALLLIGIQNDAADDTVAIEGPGNIFINPGMGVENRAGVTSWSNTQGNLWIGNNSVRFLSIHEGLQAPFTLRAPITFANSANALIFSGASNTNIALRTSPNGILSFDGGAGSLLTISNNVLGQIFSVNDISGFPIIEVTANTVPSNTMIQMGQFGSRVSIGNNTSPVSTLTVTGNTTLVGDLITTGITTFAESTEILVPRTGATGTVVHDYTTGAVFYHTSISANFTVNLTNIPTTDSRAITVTLILVQGATAYIPNALQIGGSAQTIKWTDGTTPTGNANKVDVVTFTLIRSGAAWAQVIGQLGSFG